MGLLKKVFAKGEQSSSSNPEIEVRHFEVEGFKVHYPVLEGDTVVKPGLWLNLDEKCIKSKVVNMQTFDNVYFWEEGGLIKALVGDMPLFEVTSKQKAYKELLPYSRTKASFVRFEEKEGNYGKYFKTRVVFEYGRD